MVDKTKALIRRVNRTIPKVSNIATGDFIIPNHSGDLSAGDVLTTPLNDNDPVNKKYVDDNATSVSFGTDNQIPFMNGSGDDFDYSSVLTFDGTNLKLLSDNAKFYMGAGDDAYSFFDGVNFRSVIGGNSNVIIGTETTGED